MTSATRAALARFALAAVFLCFSSAPALAQQFPYRPLADSWAVYDNSGGIPHLLEQGP